MTLQEAKDKLNTVMAGTDAVTYIEKMAIENDPWPCIAFCSQQDGGKFKVKSIRDFADHYMGTFASFDAFCVNHNPDDFYTILSYSQDNVYVFMNQKG
jgi:hypothetical protein